MKIGVFDSGIGGLSTLHQIMHTLPDEEYVFYADVDHVPYGEKTKEEVLQYVDEAVQFMVSRKCKAIVLACNTATSVAITPMRQKYKLPIIGIEPAVKPAVMHHGNKRIMVIATPITAREAKLANLIHRFDEEGNVDVVPMPGLVRLAQDCDFVSEHVMEYLNAAFAGYDLTQYSELVLGCTHYNYFKDTFSIIFPKDIEIVDGNQGVANNLKNILKTCGIINLSTPEHQDSVEYYYSGHLVSDQKELEKIHKLHERLERMLQI